MADLASRQGFDTVNLVRELRPFVQEMLYYRDDRHWNERGNAVPAQLLRNVLLGPPSSPAAAFPSPSQR